MLSIVNMTAGDLSYESVFRCLKTELTPLPRSERDILENYVVRYGIKGKEWLKERWQLGFENDENSDREDLINDIKNRAIEPFRDFYKSFRTGKHSVKDITVKLYETVDKMDVAEKLAQKAEIAENEAILTRRRSRRAALSLWESCLRTLRISSAATALR